MPQRSKTLAFQGQITSEPSVSEVWMSSLRRRKQVPPAFRERDHGEALRRIRRSSLCAGGKWLKKNRRSTNWRKDLSQAISRPTLPASR